MKKREEGKIPINPLFYFFNYPYGIKLDFESVPNQLYNNENYTTIFRCIKRRKPWSKMNERKIMTNVPDIEVPNNTISTSKYTLITFVPKNLMEQFSRLANLYFLGVGILQILPEISNTQQQPLIYVPLTVIIVISMLKDYMEDYKRKKSDKEENNREIEVLSPNEMGFINVKWRDLQIGQIIKVKRDEFLPADILILNTSEPKGVCYIETKNLDGETNLKQKIANNDVLKIFSKHDQIYEKQIWFTYESPNPYLYKFSGNVEINKNEKIPVDNQNFILRGCSIRNTQWVIGLVAYTGHDTKIMLNSIRSKSKRSTIEKTMNKQILIIFISQLIICFLCALAYILYAKNEGDKIGYTDVKNNLNDYGVIKVFIIQFGSWVLLLTNFVPISLIVTLEIVKLFQAIILTYDNSMMNPENKIRTVVQSSNLNEELGQIQYIFSDKTGTLTCNIMDFKSICVGGINYGDNSSYPESELEKRPSVTNVDFKDKYFFDVLERKSGNYQAIKDALLNLSLCHSIIIDEKDDQKIFNSSSPDEIALANFAKLCQFEFYGMDEDQNLLLKTENDIEKYKFLNMLEFNSTRKRMSVIIQDQNGKKILYCKGADSVILQRVNKKKDQQILNSTVKILNKYANIGLRTLVLSKKVIDDDFYEEWNKKFKEAAISIKNREELLDEVNELIEKDMDLIGVTAVEDKLQADVENTISFIKQASIQIWVLTGDKLETAINIALSCRLFTDNMEKIIIDLKTEEEFQAKNKNILEKLKINQTSIYALVISGDSLIVAMKRPEYSSQIMSIAGYCKAVVACRVSPKQKQEIVQMVRVAKPSVITLAIGDGANDVNMITAANVGIGIVGKEGAQAARASDYAISEFRFLRRLMFYFGRESYRKNSFLIFYNFYKNVMLVLPHIWFSFLNDFSGQLLYDVWLYQFFNLFYCSLPIIIYALFDEEYPSNYYLDTMHSHTNYLEENPHLYDLGLKNKLFNRKKFWGWVLLGAWHAAIILYVSLISMETNIANINDHSSYIFVVGMMAFSECVLIANLIIINFSNTFYPFSLMIIIISIGFYISNVYVANSIISFDSYGIFTNIFGCPNFYIGTIFIVFGCNFMEAFLYKLKLLTHLVLRKELKYSIIPGHKYDYKIADGGPLSIGLREDCENSVKNSDPKNTSQVSNLTKSMEEMKDLSPIIEHHNIVKISNIKKSSPNNVKK